MGTAMNAVNSVLGIDKVDLNGGLLLIKEHHGSDATFLISAALSNALKKSQGICLVLYHHNLEHYHNIGIRMGYNLFNAKKEGRLTVVEPLKDILNDLDNLQEGSENCTLISAKCYSKADTTLVYTHFKLVKEKYYEAKKSNESVVVVVDDLSHLFDLGISLKDVMNYVRYLRSLIQSDPRSGLCLLMHTYQEVLDSQNQYSDTAVEGLKHMASVIISSEPLRTGHSNDASGRMTVSWKIDSVRRKYGWAEENVYLYKLLDGRVRIFAPGTAGI